MKFIDMGGLSNEIKPTEYTEFYGVNPNRIIENIESRE